MQFDFGQCIAMAQCVEVKEGVGVLVNLLILKNLVEIRRRGTLTALYQVSLARQPECSTERQQQSN